jgi:hypothetical protein
LQVKREAEQSMIGTDLASGRRKVREDVRTFRHIYTDEKGKERT